MLCNIHRYLFIFGFFVHSAVKANEVDDFEHQIDKTLSEYWDFTRKYVEAERQIIAPSQIQQGIQNAIANAQIDLNRFIDRYHNSNDKIEKTLLATNLSINRFEHYLENETYDLRSLENLISERMHLADFSADLSNEAILFSDFLSALNTYNTHSSNFCTRLIPTLRVDQINLSSPPHIEDLQYQKTNPANFLNEDPVARSVAIASGTAVLATSIVIYAAIKGISFASAALTLFTIESDAAGSILLTTSGPGLIIFAVVAFATIVTGILIAEHENKKRERRARRAMDHLKDETRKAQQWFHENRITDHEYQRLAQPICAQSEEPGETSKKHQSVIFKFRQSIEQIIKSVAIKQEFFIQQHTILKENIEAMDQSIANYKTQLSKQISKELITHHIEKIHSQRKISKAWNYYHTKIKNRWNIFSQALDELDSCAVIGEHANISIKNIELETQHLLNITSDNLNREDSFFKEIPRLVASMKQRIIQSANLCSDSAKKGDEDEVSLPFFTI